MRWKLLCRSLALLLAGVVGCKQVGYLNTDDVERYKELGLPPDLDKEPCLAKPVTPPGQAPGTIFDPDRPIRYMSLAESIAIALEQGTVGNTSTQIGNLFGQIPSVQTSIDQPSNFQSNAGGRVGVSDSIKVLRLDPAIVGAGIEGSLSRFDAVFTSSMNWTTTDRPIATVEDVIQAGANQTSINQQDATPSFALLKPLPTGGIAGITFSVPYEKSNLAAPVNPAYRPDLQFSLEQPLLQGFGVDINQIKPNTPGSILNPGIINTQPTAEGILITRIRFDQQRAEFERLCQYMVTNVEQAYWNLFYAYWNLYAQEQGLRQAFEALRIQQARFNAGRLAVMDLAQSRGQYETFRAQRLQALNDVLDLERQFRAMLGMQTNDGVRLVPSDQPTLAPFKPDFNTAMQEALALRPEILQARQEVKVAQLNLKAQEDNLLPDLRSTLTYDVNSIGTRLDGADTSNAFRNLSSDHFNNWSAGLRLTIPIGFRLANSNVRIAQLQLARAFEVLRDNENKIKSFLWQQYDRIELAYELIRAQRAGRDAYAQNLRGRYEEFVAGRGTLDILLEAQRLYAVALSAEYQAIRDYNNSLATFEFAKGTILTRNNIVIAESGLPTFAKERAVEHLRERSAALELGERPDPVGLGTGPTPATCPMAVSPLDNPANLPTLWKQTPPLPMKDLPVDSLPLSSAPTTHPMDSSAAGPSSLPIAPGGSTSGMTGEPLPTLEPKTASRGMSPRTAEFGAVQPVLPSLDIPGSTSSGMPEPGFVPQR